MLPNIVGASPLNSFINQFWLLYRSDIMVLNKKWFKEEDIKEKSLIQYNVMQYYNSLYYVTLIYFEVQRNIHTEWSWYEDNFKIEKFRRCLGCHSIDLDKVLLIFNLPISSSIRGIEHIGIESNFIVEPTNLTVSPPNPIIISITNLLDNPDKCIKFFSEIC